MREYHIEFSRVDKKSPRMVSTTCSLGSAIVHDGMEMKIDLCNDPLYYKLEEYVLANPTAKNQK